MMIISASRRTDIPTYYSDWFFNRIKDGYVCIRNPMNIHQISKVSLDPTVVDGIVFWTKNPIPMMGRLDELRDYMYYFQFTVNPYGPDVEQNVPSKSKIIIPTFKELSKKIGKNRVIWRYDPIFLTQKYSIEYHEKFFSKMAEILSAYTDKCIISFLDLYRNTRNNTKDMGLIGMSQRDIEEISRRFSAIADRNGLRLESCSEEINLIKYGIMHGHCIDCNLFEDLLGYHLNLEKDKNQRLECGCVSSIDIGMYNTCKNHCLYCYANYSQTTVEKNYFFHNPHFPLISGEIEPDDIIKDRKVSSCKNCQLNMFDL